jgi:co-chaperonin GroES (HSP10)
MTMTEAATKPKLVSTPPVTDEEWEARLPIPCQYHILVALPDIEDFYQGTSLLKTESEKRREYITSIMGIVIDLGPTAYLDKDKFPMGPSCKPGDYVMYRMNTGTRFTIPDQAGNGKEFRLMNDDSVEAVIPDPRGICNV